MTLALVSTLQKEARTTFSKAVIESPVEKPEHDKSGKGQKKGSPQTAPEGSEPKNPAAHVYIYRMRAFYIFISKDTTLSLSRRSVRRSRPRDAHARDRCVSAHSVSPLRASSLGFPSPVEGRKRSGLVSGASPL